MLRKEQNDLLTQTGPATPMGAMFRSYWIPALLSEELPENDCAPVRVKLLSESLVAIRDSEGRYGLISEFCAHRGVSLWFGRNAEGDEALRHELDPHRRAVVVRQFFGQQRRQPVRAEHLPHGRSGAGPGQKFVLFFPQHSLVVMARL